MIKRNFSIKTINSITLRFSTTKYTLDEDNHTNIIDDLYDRLMHGRVNIFSSYLNFI